MSNCCCSQCGVALPYGNFCCKCVPDKLCVEIADLTGSASGDNCDCDYMLATANWSSALCGYYVGITCGSHLLGLVFEVVEVDGGCDLVLTCACLHLNQARADTGSSSAIGDFLCGEYKQGCAQSGGFERTWYVDATDCEILFGSATANTCNLLSIRTYAYPRMNPAGQELNKACKDCDCICTTMRFTYAGVTQDVDYAYGVWTATFDTQTITLQIQRGANGRCYWAVDVTEGYIDDLGSGTGTGTTGVLFKTNCPSVSISTEVRVGTASPVTLSITCANCEQPGLPTGECCYCGALHLTTCITGFPPNRYVIADGACNWLSTNDGEMTLQDSASCAFANSCLCFSGLNRIYECDEPVDETTEYSLEVVLYCLGSGTPCDWLCAVIATPNAGDTLIYYPAIKYVDCENGYFWIEGLTIGTDPCACTINEIRINLCDYSAIPASPTAGAYTCP